MKIQPTVGTFLAQGFVGGALGGFIYVFLITLWEGSSDIWAVLSFTCLCMILGSIIGELEAACSWGLYSSLGIQMRAVTRVTVASGIATLFVVFAGLQFKGVESALSSLLMAALSFVVPPALMIGSNFRPWGLFTAGTIAVRGDGVDEFYESNSMWAIVGSVPLRFLSLGIAALWLLIIAQQPKGEPPYIPLIIVGGLPLLYMGISAFLTFRSPGKLLLLLLGIGGNIPVVMGSLLSFSLYRSFYGMWDMLVLTIICWSFLFSWAVFLFARLSVDTSELRPLSILPDKLPETASSR